MKQFLYVLIFLFSVTTAKAATIITAHVSGLVCEFCAFTIEKKFRSMKDIVEKVKVDLDSGEVVIDLKEGQNLTNEAVTDTIVNNGYNVENIQRSE